MPEKSDNKVGRHLKASKSCLVLLFKAVCFLFIRRLSWFDSSGLGFSLEYPTISLHAISRDVSAYPQEHLYVMVNDKLNSEAKFTSELYIPFYLFRPPKICSFWGAGGSPDFRVVKACLTCCVQIVSLQFLKEFLGHCRLLLFPYRRERGRNGRESS